MIKALSVPVRWKGWAWTPGCFTRSETISRRMFELYGGVGPTPLPLATGDQGGGGAHGGAYPREVRGLHVCTNSIIGWICESWHARSNERLHGRQNLKKKRWRV